VLGIAGIYSWWCINVAFREAFVSNLNYEQRQTGLDMGTGLRKNAIPWQKLWEILKTPGNALSDVLFNRGGEEVPEETGEAPPLFPAFEGEASAEAPAFEAPVEGSPGYPTRTTRNEAVDIERRIQGGAVLMGADIDVDGMIGPRTLDALNKLFGLDLEEGDTIPGDVADELLGM